MRRTLLVSLLSTRSVVLLGAMLLALALIALAIGISANKADAATNIVTKTFSKPAKISIPAGAVLPGCTTDINSVGEASPYPSKKIVSAFPAGSHIRDVNLTLKNFTDHNSPKDVDVLLVHGGRNRTVMSDVGGGTPVSNINLLLNDEANSPLPDDGLAGGSFKPRNADGNSGSGDFFPSPAPAPDARSALSGFDGQNPNKTWSLFVRDDFSFDCGEFGGGWSIRIKAAVPQ
jgi:hypothetical protein